MSMKFNSLEISIPIFTEDQVELESSKCNLNEDSKLPANQVCKDCPSVFQTKAQLTKHYKREHGGVKYSCDQCTFQTKIKYHIKKHCSEEHDGKRYYCDICEYQTKRNNCLKLHKRTTLVGICGNVLISCDFSR